MTTRRIAGYITGLRLVRSDVALGSLVPMLFAVVLLGLLASDRYFVSL